MFMKKRVKPFNQNDFLIFYNYTSHFPIWCGSMAFFIFIKFFIQMEMEHSVIKQ